MDQDVSIGRGAKTTSFDCPTSQSTSVIPSEVTLQQRFSPLHGGNTKVVSISINSNHPGPLSGQSH